MSPSHHMDFTDEQLERYSRHIILKELGGKGQQRLLAAKVLVVGAGGLGAPLLLYLAAAGVGTLAIVDDDVVDLSNLQRQVIHDTVSIGTPKVVSAAKRIEGLNPDVKVEQINRRLTAGNAAALFAPYDIIVDGSDNFETRLAVSDAAVEAGKTLVSAAIGPFEGQIATFSPHTGDDQPCYRCFMPAVPEGRQETCSDRGILGAVAGIIGSLQALEVMKQITNIGDRLTGRMMIFDTLSLRSRIIKLRREAGCPACGERPMP